MRKFTKNNVTKIYCEKCDSIFDSRQKFEKHLDDHTGVSCESCPIDTAISKLTGLFRRKSSENLE